MTTPGHPPAPAPPAPARDLTGVTLRTERLILRPWTEADVDAITEACQDPVIQRYVPVSVPYTRANAETFVRVTAPHIRATGSGAIFGVFAAATGEAVGSLGLHDLNRLDQPYGGAGEIGYWTAPGARGRGYMTEAVREVCRWGFEELGLARIEWLAIAGNEGSWRVAQKAGFTLEGTLRAKTVQRGVREDTWIGSLLRTELRSA